MDKKSFLDELRKKLSFLPKDELEKTVAYYGEMISDRIDAGMSEEEAVKAVGSIDEIVESVRTEGNYHHTAETENKNGPLTLIMVWIGIIAAYFALIWDIILSVGFVIGTVFTLIASIPATITLGMPALLIFIGIALIQTALFLITIPISGYLRYAIRLLNERSRR